MLTTPTSVESPMSMETTDEAHGTSSRVVQRVEAIRDSPPLLGVLLGIALIGVGALLAEGAIAGMFGIYGSTVVFVSATMYAALVVLRRNH